MDSLWLEYAWTLLILIGLEGLLSADNALVIAVMVKHLPKEQRKKALFYGILGAFVFRFSALFAISFLVNVWQVQAIGAAYLMFIGLKHIYKQYRIKNQGHVEEKTEEIVSAKGFWKTVVQVELADIAFAVDSILAAVALALALPETPLPQIGGMDGGQFAVIFLGGFIGLLLIRTAATYISKVLRKRPGLETAAYLIVTWVGVKLVVLTLSHKKIGIISEHFAHSIPWKFTFYSILVAIAVAGWILSDQKKEPGTKRKQSKEQTGNT
ncbi:TerC family protein [Pseudalkalibacillus salsuginis]|uniref:TerC family protein n=1 Tax=Pseudalkalibacillus salsuginis TaxID=2910972 RepID=UPI001F48AFF7|nr:TerC family protein [Pseudalkalibacillus salsuginis]MCF6409285.1 TerC family protein [Pseudalkalibacillus salsuginis]